MRQITTIFFDLDGVLTTDPTGSYSTTSYLARKLGLNHEYIFTCLKKHIKNLDLGIYRFQDIWSEIGDCIGRKIPITTLYEAFENTPKK